MLSQPIEIIAVLLAIEAAILYLAEHPKTARAFKYLPSMFWIYFLPMLANNLGLLPQTSDVYAGISRYCLPACLVLLLLAVDIRGIAKLGKVALVVMLAGSVGIMLGGPIVMLLLGHWLPQGMWSGFGALSASWIGGSANMLAVREALDTPRDIYTPIVVVDTICPYAWMGLLIFMSGYQKFYDRWNGSKVEIVERLSAKALTQEQAKHHLTLRHVAVMFAVAAVGTYVSMTLGDRLPSIKNMVNSRAWAIILASCVGVAVSFTPVKRLECYGASKLGYGLLYFVLASIGAQTNLSSLGAVPILILGGFIWIGIHACCLIIAGRIMKAPMSLLASASQANIGGPASAPVVAGIYQPALAPVGLMMAILGNIMGTYLGIISGYICRLVSQL